MILNSTFAGNIAEQGGAFWNLGGILSFESTTLAFNRGDREGAAIYALVAPYAGDDTSLSIRNSILWGNGGAYSSLFVDESSRLQLAFTAVEEPFEGEGVLLLEDNPFELGAQGELFLLQEDNPCLDAGKSDGQDWDWQRQTTALDGRPDEGALDLGRHYRVSESLD